MFRSIRRRYRCIDTTFQTSVSLYSVRHTYDRSLLARFTVLRRLILGPEAIGHGYLPAFKWWQALSRTCGALSIVDLLAGDQKKSDTSTPIVCWGFPSGICVKCKFRMQARHLGVGHRSELPSQLPMYWMAFAIAVAAPVSVITITVVAATAPRRSPCLKVIN